MYYSADYLSPVGKLTLAAGEDHLVGLWIEGQKYFMGKLKTKPEKREDLPIFMKTKEWLDRYFAGEKPDAGILPLAPEGSPFQQTVWKLLCEIPYGEVITYGALAKKAARRLHRESMSAQATGGAVGHNPISIIIPCHRVVGTDGNLTGYAGGIDNKIKLLTLEGIDTNRFYFRS